MELLRIPYILQAVLVARPGQQGLTEVVAFQSLEEEVQDGLILH